MPIISPIEHGIIALLVCILAWMVWKHHYRRLRKLWEKVKAGRPRHWRPKSPRDCPACQEGVSLVVHRVGEAVVPWSQVRSPRGRKKRVETAEYACPDPDCDYFGITDPEVHALVGYGKRGKCHDIQTLKCQACECVFSSRRNTPLYYLKTAHDRVEIVLWLLAEGVDVSVLVRYTGHVDATLTRWLVRAGAHSQRLHDRLFADLKLPYLQVDELHAPVAGNRRHSWLWVAIEPVSKIIPAIHLGTRKTEDAYRFIHNLSLRLAPGWVPAFTSDGLRAYFYALTAHFGARLPGGGWRVSLDLIYGQLVKHRERRGQVNFATMRMILGKRWQLAQILLSQGLSTLIQTAFIERVNLTIRQGVAPLSRKTWSMAKSSQHLLLHVEWWRSYYHLIRAHESLRLRVPGLKHRYRQRSPAMAAGLTDHLWQVGDILSLPLLPEGGAC